MVLATIRWFARINNRLSVRLRAPRFPCGLLWWLVMSLRVGSPGGPSEHDDGLAVALEERLRERLGTKDFDAWFAGTPCRYDPSGGFVFTAQTPFRTKWIETKYASVVRDIAAELCEGEVGLRFESVGSPGRLNAPGARPADGTDPSLGTAHLPDLDDFVVGPGNRVAYAAATAVVEHPGKTYSPLCVHGPSGVGKTHLLQGVARHLQETSNLTVCYSSSEDFTNNYIEAAAQRDLGPFHFRYRECAVLILDDIHFLAGKKKTLAEFLSVVEHHLDVNNQVVLSSSLDPGELAGLPPRLLGRFRSGLITPIEVPNFETRVAAVSAMADRKGFRLPPVTAEYLAQHITDNLRELEGALNCLINIARLHQSPLTLEMAKVALDEFLDLSQDSPAGGVSAENIIAVVLDHYGREAADLLSAKKVRTIVRGRQVGMYLARQLTPLSLTQIGSLFGGRDHTTVLYALRQIEKKLSSDQRLRSEVESIRSRLSVAHLR